MRRGCPLAAEAKRVAGASAARGNQRAFTVTELLAIMGVLGLLALTILPAMAGGWDKATRARCAQNLRQLHAASMQFANDNDHWLPKWRAGQGVRENEMTASHYSRYVWYGPPVTFVPPEPPQAGAGFENAGHLYESSLIDPQVLFCPTLLEGPYSDAYYSPLLTSDAGGVIRSSYFYNPRVINAGNIVGHPIDLHRRYQKTTQLEPHKLFASDVVAGTVEWAHAHHAERGWNVLFTDGSVALSRSGRIYNLNDRIWDTGPTPSQLDGIFDWLEQER